MIKLLSTFVILSLWTSAYGQLAYDESYPLVRLPRRALFGLFGHHAAVAVPAPAHPAPAPHGGPYQPGYPTYPANSAYPHHGGTPTAVPAPAYTHHGGTPTAVAAPAYPGGGNPYRPVAFYGQAPHYFLY